MVRTVILLLLVVLLAACGGQAPTGTPILPTKAPVLPPLDPTQEFLRSCIGWNCSLEGTVYANAAAPGNELEGVQVHVEQVSYCSPTAGSHEAATGADGTFRFPVYLHDTDSFNIEVVVEGYQPVAHKLGGFDCLYCACDPLEIILQPVN